jgi:hypothetical protein
MLEQIGSKEHQPKVTIRRKVSQDDEEGLGLNDDEEEELKDDYDSDDY